jgi:hypothetical protein
MYCKAFPRFHFPAEGLRDSSGMDAPWYLLRITSSSALAQL